VEAVEAVVMLLEVLLFMPECLVLLSLALVVPLDTQAVEQTVATLPLAHLQ
jgi:hypothetical protein